MQNEIPDYVITRVSMILEASGYRVTSVESGTAGLVISITKRIPNPDMYTITSHHAYLKQLLKPHGFFPQSVSIVEEDLVAKIMPED